jgi:hypothetical protein
MPARSPNSLASRDLESTSDNDALICTPSPPPRESSHDEYTLECPSNVISRTGTQFILPSSRTDTIGSPPSDVRVAIHELYNEIYGENCQRCLVTLSTLSLVIAHAVQRASKHHQVSHVSVVSS